MATKEARAWTYTAGYNTLQQSTIHPPVANEIKGLGTTPHMLVKINACALNPVDVQIMNLPTWKLPGNKKPKTTVCDFSGTVIAGGRSGFVQGEEVMGLTLKPMKDCAGALAEVAHFDLADLAVVKKPKELSHEKAAAINLVWLTAKACIKQVEQWVEDTQSKRVAVLGGSSAVGIYTIMLAKRKGWKVVTTSSGKNKDFVTNNLRADAHVDYTSVPSTRNAVAEFKPDAVIDCVGGTECIGLPSSKRYVSIVGDKTARLTMGGPYTYYNFLSYHAPLQWIRWFRGYMGFGESYDVIILEMDNQWLEEAKSTLTPDDIYIDSVFQFDEARKAFERLNSGRAKGKVVVKISDTGLNVPAL
ncbi:GroES-like protein [Teratosphaeria destructans]|uniref:GroES-like protein n=1 Tax=Teratosphaeria destructans TaxID=418781 RepID=A0A9W7W740_9PEZI|nr:GroES-like protein [Teratosphaeria destructans]